MIKHRCLMCGTEELSEGVSPEVYAEAVLAQAQALDKLQEVSFLLGGAMGHNADETHQRALIQFEKLFGSLRFIVDRTSDEFAKKELMELIDRFKGRKTQLRKLKEQTNDER